MSTVNTSNDLILYPLLNLRSKRAILRTYPPKSRFKNKLYIYNPKPILLNRLASQTGMTENQVRQQLLVERRFLLKNKNYYLPD